MGMNEMEAGDPKYRESYDEQAKTAKIPGPGPVIKMESGIEVSSSRDPWAHRSTMMKCKTCMFYVPKVSVVMASETGRCRRHAPTMSGYPVVFFSDWCGDHKLDENCA